MLTGLSSADGSQSLQSIMSQLMSGIKFTVASYGHLCQSLSVLWDAERILVYIVSAWSEMISYHEIILTALVDVPGGMFQVMCQSLSKSTKVPLIVTEIQ